MADVKIVDFSAGQPDPWDTVGKALQVAGTVYGIKDARDKLELLKKQTEAEAPAKKLAYESELQKYTQAKETEARQKRGEFLQEDYAKLYKPAELDKSGKPPPGAQPIKVIEGDQVKTVLSVPKSDSAINDYLKLLTTQKLTQDLTDIEGPKALAAGFAQRVARGMNDLTKLSEKGYDAAALSSAFKNGNFYPEGIKDENTKLYGQAKRNIINAILRRESGANITKDEFASADAQYFDLPGDTPLVKEQKRQNLSDALSSLKLAAGDRALKKLGIPEVKSPGGGLQVGSVQDGYKFKGGDPADQNNWEKVK